MSWGNLVVCIIFIFVGLWVRFFPNSIAGINMMTQEEKEKFDLEKYSKLLFRLIIGFAITVGPGYYLLYWLGFTYVADYLIIWGLPVFIIMMGIFYFRSQLPDKK